MLGPSAPTNRLPSALSDTKLALIPNDFVEGWDRWVRRSEAAGFAEQHGYEFIADE